jgi:hypothetical protein
MDNEHLSHWNEQMTSILMACKVVLNECSSIGLDVSASPRQIETMACAALTLGTITLQNFNGVVCNTVEDKAKTELAAAAIDRLSHLCDRWSKK